LTDGRRLAELGATASVVGPPRSAGGSRPSSSVPADRLLNARATAPLNIRVITAVSGARRRPKNRLATAAPASSRETPTVGTGRWTNGGTRSGSGRSAARPSPTTATIVIVPLLGRRRHRVSDSDPPKAQAQLEPRRLGRAHFRGSTRLLKLAAPANGGIGTDVSPEGVGAAGLLNTEPLAMPKQTPCARSVHSHPRSGA
jgi:hypothetical protein